MITITSNGPGGNSPFARFQWMKATIGWTDFAGPFVRETLKNVAPVGNGPNGGQLKMKIRFERRVTAGSVALWFGVDVPYAEYVIKGTKPHVIRPVAAKALRFTGTHGATFARVVHHPGTRPNDFPTRAMAIAGPIIKARFDTVMRELGG